MRGRKPAVIVAVLVAALAVASAGAAASPQHVHLSFSGTETQSTPVPCGTGFVTTTVTLKGTSTDNSTIFGTADPGPFTLTSPSNGLLIRAATTVNTNTGQGYSKGTFYLKEDATHRVYGTFSAVQQAKVRIESDEAYRQIAEKAVAAASENTTALSSIQTALADVRTRLAAIEKVLKEVE